jgi:hypothetical protein
MQQQWIIDGVWSHYHLIMAGHDGWGLSQIDGMWQVVALDMKKFPTSEDARLHVLANEHHQDSSLYATAIHAVIVGNMR